MDEFSEEILKTGLAGLQSDIPELIDTLAMKERVDMRGWREIMDTRLIPRLSPDFPLVVSICGGGSSGKSTLFNSLNRERLSTTGGKAGINRRILCSVPEKYIHREEIMNALFEPFGSRYEPLDDREQLREPGCPLYIVNDSLPVNMVLLDTPDFDTGAKGEYVNREVVKKALEASDVLIYIFTNANYNNRDNTDFISEMLTGLGMRKCFLVYRVSSDFGEAEVIEHLMTVARNIYGALAENYLLGLYRADEDNAVAGGERFMELKPVRAGDPLIEDALNALDPRSLRPELLASIIESVVDKSKTILQKADNSEKELRLYIDVLKVALSRSVQQALLHFPMERVMGRFSQMWMKSDPAYIRYMRHTGKVVGLPYRAISGTIKWAGKTFFKQEEKIEESEFKNQMEEDLLNAVSELRNMAVSSEIVINLGTKDPVTRRLMELVEEIRVNEGITGKRPPYVEFPENAGGKGLIKIHSPAHPVVFDVQEQMKQKNWQKRLPAILSHKEQMLTFSESVDRELESLVIHFRNRMNFGDKMRQTLSAALNVLPATVAVTYIVSTGDPVGAAGIKAKLTGLFGLNDLYALIAIPASSGINKADRKQLETLLGPVAQTWLEDKLKGLKALFEREITGELENEGIKSLEEAKRLREQIQTHIKNIEKGAKQSLT